MLRPYIGLVNMTKQAEIEYLEKFAIAANNRLYSSHADLDPKDRPLPEMHTWCEKQGDIVVMNSGLILSSDPSSRSVQNCKILMRNKGIKPGKVYPATSELITMLLANAQMDHYVSVEKTIDKVSIQQQRLRLLVREAIDAEVTDIHMEVRTDVTRIRFRKHGELYLHAEWLANLGREIAAVAFNKETDHATTHFNPLVPQNASMPLQIEDQDVRLRLASMPAHGGFDMVMRVLTTGDARIQSLRELGYTPEHVDIIQRALHMPNGAIMVAGPTGSGKTTTLASCVQMIAPERKVYTIEDPIEKIVDSATQVPVNSEQEDRTFASLGRAALRMDPDVIVMGEILDEDAAKVKILRFNKLTSILHRKSKKS